MPASLCPLSFAPDARTAKRVFEFFTANIRNPNTRKAYAKAAADFAAWCEARDLDQRRDVQPVHVAAYVEDLQQRVAAPSVKLHLAAIRMLFDWLVVGQVMPSNPASGVTGGPWVTAPSLLRTGRFSCLGVALVERFGRELHELLGLLLTACDDLPRFQSRDLSLEILRTSCAATKNVLH